ncbi:MAG: PDZ domain-containing protein [Desulfobulbaceae bacterium]|nr:PDZ domain-containing protein [Desulfobulbaceae bacterium]
MPNKPCSPWRIGAKPRRCEVFPPLALLLTALAILWLAPPARAALPPVVNLEISFDLSQARLTGLATLEFPAQSGDLLHLPGMTITGLSVDGQSIDLANRQQPYFADPDHEVTIAPSAHAQSVKVAYTLDLSQRSGPVGDLISPAGISLTGNWHPILHQDALFHLTAELPSGFAAISEAEEISSTPSPSGQSVAFHFDHPLPGLHLIAGPFEVSSTSFGEGRQLSTYFFAEDHELAATYRDKALAYLARYESMFGSFPYRRFSVVENRLPTGYAMPTFTVLGQSVVRLPFIADTSLGHEIVHQWFGTGVRPAYEDGNWSEGLTTLLADQLYQEEQGQGNEYRKQQLTAYQGYVHANNTLTLKQFTGAQSHLLAGQEAGRAIGYTKAALVLHSLKKQLGEEKFLAGLRDFYQRFKYQQAGWSDLATSFETVSGATLSDFFKQWLERPDLPSLGITTARVNEEEGKPVLHLTLSQINAAPYQLTVPVRVLTDAGDVRREVAITLKDTEVEIPLAAQPQTVVLDENYDLPRQLNGWELAPVWSRFAGAAKKLLVVDPNGGEELYARLISQIKEMGGRTVADADLKDSDLAEGAVIFLGTASQTARRLFATPNLPTDGFTIEVRANPLNSKETAVLVAAANATEVEAAAYKLRHYGKYSYLHFLAGRLQEKKIAATDAGQIFTINEPPGGLALPQRLSFADITGKLQANRVVYIGETHTRYEDHLLQLRVIRAMYHQSPELAIGMEMFNRVDQPILDRYVLDHTIDESEFLRQSHYFSKWSYDYRNYRDIINFARANRIPVLALNLDKETVSSVYQGKGLDGLSKELRASLPPERDLSLPDYRERIISFFMMHQQQPGQENKFNDFFEAQALWDETMAETAADYLRANPERRLAVLAGRGHVEKENAIPPRLARRLAVSQAVVLNAEPKEITGDSADFVLFSPAAELPPPAMMGVVLKQDGDRVVIDDLSPHGQGMKMGLQKGDIFLSLDGHPIKTIEDLKIIMFFKKHGGDKVKVKIKRLRRIFPDQELEMVIPL